MKKHFILTSLFACAFIAAAPAETLATAGLQMPGTNFEPLHAMAEQQAGAFNHYGHAYTSDRHGDCDKCRKHKKSQKHGACSKPGNHYGHHKNRGQQNSCCNHGQTRDCGDRDRWSERDRRDQRGDRWGNGNRGDRREDNNRRFEPNRRNGDREYGGTSTRSSERRGSSSGQVKTNRTGTTRRVGSRPTGART